LLEFSNYCDFLSVECAKLRKCSLIIAGDFNINLLQCGDNVVADQFIDCMYSYGLFPSISRPTRVLKNHASLIDNIFVSDPFLASSGIICTDISDHFPIFACLKSIASLQSLHTANITSITRSITSSSVASLQRHLQSQSWDFITEYSNANDDYDCFSNVLTHAIHKCLPTKRITTHNSSTAAWLTPALKNSCVTKKKMYLAALCNSALWNDYKVYRNKLTSLIRARKKQYYSEFIMRHKGNSRAMWQLINSHLGRLCKDVSTFSISANALNNYFIELGLNAVKDLPPVRHHFAMYLRHRVTESFFVSPITCSEIIAVVKTLPSKSSCDCNGLSVKLLKCFINNIVSPLCLILNKCLAHGVFPDGLKIAKVVPVYKSGDKCDLKNYRPISLLPIISKIFEKLMLCRISAFFSKHNVLNLHQHGFRPSFSTSSALIDVLDCITAALDRKFVALALFIDVSKAFDSLNHNILLAKLEHYGVRGVALSWFASYLSNRFQYIEYNGDCSLLRLIVCGVPQGSVLGPYLYLVYVNDIFNVSDEVKCVLYADDTSIIVTGRDINSVFNRAPVLFSLFSTWFINNRLALNSKKTNFILFSLKRLASPCDLTFDLYTVHKVDNVKYLGFF
jgi:hypothetical protein